MNTEIIYSNKTLYVKLNGDIDHHSAKYIREEIDRELYKYQPETVIMELSSPRAKEMHFGKRSMRILPPFRRTVAFRSWKRNGSARKSRQSLRPMTI